MQDRSEYDLSEGTLEDAWYVSVGVNPAFVERYRAKYGNDNVISGAAVYYEVGKLLLEVLKPGQTSEQILAALFQLRNSQRRSW